MDEGNTIKVSDFGLSLDIYEKNYFRQEKSDGIKLPIKWMAIESMTDGVFSEKTDVVSILILKLKVILVLSVSCICDIITLNDNLFSMPNNDSMSLCQCKSNSI